MDNRTIFRNAARAEGVPEHLIAWVQGFARPRMEMHSSGEGNSAGWYGGFPVLPADAEWDGTPDLIATIDCAAIPQDVLDFPMPWDGRLLFFADNVNLHSDRSPGGVRYVTAGAAAAERARTRDERARRL